MQHSHTQPKERAALIYTCSSIRSQGSSWLLGLGLGAQMSFPTPAEQPEQIPALL